MPTPRVLIVDDSSMVRELLTNILRHDGTLDVVGTAMDPYVAWTKIHALAPDVLTLDVEMPRMDGLTFLEKLMRARPMPVVMVSTLTDQGAETTLRALELGAVDFVTKPKLDVARGVGEIGDEIRAKVKAAAKAHVRTRRVSGSSRPRTLASRDRALVDGTERVVAIAASTGGTEALREVLSALPVDAPGTVVVQHMPERFTTQFARRLNEVCAMEVREAADGDRVLPGRVLIAPGSRHMEVVRSGGTYLVRLTSAPPVNHHRPSADVLFESVAAQVGRHAVGIVLTGMGADGANGLRTMRERGARTAAQDEATSVVFGMPKEAIARGGAEHVVPLEGVAAAILRLSGHSP